MGKKRRKPMIGIDLGGTKMLTALIDPNGKIQAKVKEKTRTENGIRYFLEILEETITTVADEAGYRMKEIGGIGIGCPGVVSSEKGTILCAPNLSILTEFKLASKLQKIVRRPVVIENDVNAGLYGEFSFGAARGHKNIVGIFIGTGIGGALVLNGKLFTGSSGAAGEIGHMLIDPLGPACGCGKTGCLEALCGRVAIAAEAAALAVRQKAKKLLDLSGSTVSNIKSGVLSRSIQSGDRAIRDLLLRKSRLIGVAAANIVNVLNPDMIVLGGGVVEAMPELIVREVEKTVKSTAMAPLAAKVKVAAAKLGDFAVLRGAARLAEETIYGNEHA